MASDSEYFPTLKAVAERYGVNRRALDRWREVYPDGFAETPQGYSAAGIKEARRRFVASGKNVRLCAGDVENVQERAVKAETEEEFEDLDTLKLRKMTEEWKKLVNQNSLFHHLYVLKSKVEREQLAIWHGLMESFSRVGAEVCYQVSGKTPAEAREIIEDAIRRKLEKVRDIDFTKFEAAIQETGEITPKKMRAPAIRKTNGRQKAS